MKHLVALGKEILNSQPFSRLIGATLEEVEPGRVVLSLEVTDNLKQQHGFVHGGVISYLADNALTFAGGSILGNSVTAEYKINYIAPGLGEKLLAQAEVVRAGKRQAVCKCEIFSINKDEKSIIAFASGSIRKFDK